MAVYEAAAGPLALDACRRALSEAQSAPGEITHLVTVSCTGFFAPGVEFELIEGLGLCPDVARTHIGFQGCHAAMNAMRVAAGFTKSNPDNRILICALELCSLHQQYGREPRLVVDNALFADGAGALIVTGEPPDADSDHPWIAASGSTVLSDSSELMAWRIGDHGFRMTLSSRVPDIIRERLPGWIDPWLASHGFKRNQIGGWAVHPGGPRILDAAAEALDLEETRIRSSREVLREFGNMSSPTILFIVERLRHARVPRPWVAIGFGPGLAVEAVLIR